MSITDEAFWSRVDKTDECWLWTGSRTTAGYGNLKRSGVNEYAHRYAYELAIGPIPKGLVIDHLCRVRNCVNPAHLEPVTRGENTIRGLLSYEIRDACKNGHDITDVVNVYVNPRGHRHCRPCARESARVAYHAKKGAANV